MKNVTITLDEDLAAWARVEAAKHGKSVSRFIADILARERPRKISQLEAVERFLSGPKWPLSDENGRLPTREEFYAERTDQLLRRHEYPALHEGSQGDGKK